jgi:hypothetical protein
MLNVPLLDVIIVIFELVCASCPVRTFSAREYHLHGLIKSQPIEALNTVIYVGGS